LLRQILLKYLERKNITPNDKFLKKMNQIIDSLIDCDININGMIGKEYDTVEEMAYSLNNLFSSDCKKRNGVYFTPLTTTKLMAEQVLLENNIAENILAGTFEIQPNSSFEEIARTIGALR